MGLFPSHKDAPRVVVTNGMMIPNYSKPDDWEKFNALGVSQYGQMTAGSYMYIGPQGIVHGTTAVTRGVSTATTGGLGNPIFATIELGGSVVTSVMAIFAPILAIVLIALILLLVAKKILPKLRKSRTPQAL